MSEEKEFKKRYKDLNTAQKEAVDAIEGPVMVIAGPGTGKTTVLTLRIANILKNTDTPPSGILAITYTESGVRSMRMKLREIIGTLADEVHIHTFHGFASWVINEYGEYFIHLDKAEQMSDIDRENLIREILQDEKFRSLRPSARPDHYIQKIIKTIDEAKKEAKGPKEVRDLAKEEMERIKNDEGNISTRGKSKGKLKADAEIKIEKCERTIVFSDVYGEYEKRKKEKEFIDFYDLLVELLSAMEINELLLRSLQERFLYILVDEHQDTNDIQNLILEKISDFFDEPNIFIVGDEKQAIYRFQGASVENFLKFQNRWENMKIIKLKDNYRSHQGILDTVFPMIENNYKEGEYKDLRVKLKSKCKLSPELIKVIEAESVKDTEKYILKRIKNILKNEPNAEIAIITRKNRELENVIELLENSRVPVSSKRRVNIFKHPAGKLFFDLIEFLNDNTKYDFLARGIFSGLWSLSFEDSVDLVRTLRTGKDVDLYKYIPAIKELKEDITTDGALKYLIEVGEVSGYVNIISKDPANIEVWRGIISLSEYLIRNKDIKDPRELISELLLYKKSSEERSVEIPIGIPDAPVKAMTAHGSKGLEFDYVFIPYATENYWIGKERGSSFVLESSDEDHRIKDIRRLFYVATTRAKHHVEILYSKSDERDRSLTPLRFIDELEESCLSRKNISYSSDKDIPRAIGKKKGRFEKIGEVAKRSIVENGLSVTALNHFMECPNKFLYESVLKFPQAPNVSTEKGNAMHSAFSKVWATEDRSEENILKVINGSINGYFESSLLPLFEKEGIKKELLENAPIVAKELSEHFLEKGDILTESWVQTTLQYEYSSKKIDIPIHGKLDAIILDNKSVGVFDYKTRKKMTVNEIKGKTQNSDGGYFRQLVFYKMLLEGSGKSQGKEIIPSLVFVSPDKKGRCPIITIPVENDDIKKVKEEIEHLAESVLSGNILDLECEEDNCEYCNLKNI